MQALNPRLIWLFVTSSLLTVILSNCLSFIVNQLSDIYKWKDVIPNHVIWLLAVILSVLLACLALWAVKLQNNLSSGTTPRKTVSPQVLQDWRRKLLRVVKGDVDERLEKSLHNQVLIPLDMDEWGKQSLVPQPEDTNKQQANFLVATAELLKPIVSWIRSGQNTPLPPQTKIIDVFHQEGKLLILGSPGSGKTTLLLQLAQDLTANAQADDNKPIPVIFELTNWKINQQIPNWLIEQLKFQYNIPEDIAKEWLKTNQVLPLLDGLDELKENQINCIHAINDYINQDTQPFHLVVCCRSQEYDDGNTVLRLNAVCVQALNQTQIQAYFARANRLDLWNGINRDADLLELAETPLILKIMVQAYQQRPASKSQNFSSPEARRQAYLDDLFDAYIKHKLEEGKESKWYERGKEPTPEETKRWLAWLAKKLKDKKQTEFLIEKMQPTWLEKSYQKWLYRVAVGLIVGLISGLISGLIVGLISGLIFGLILGLSGGLSNKIELTESFNLSWQKIINDWR